jgi:hypothetical protein
MSVALTLVLAVETASLGFSASTADLSTIATYTLRLVFTIYILILAVRSMNQDSTDTHSESLWHLSSFAASALLFATAILPPTPIPVAEASSQTLDVFKSLGWASLALYFISFAIISTIPQGPPLHFDPEKIYSEKTIATTTNVAPDNVCGVTGAFPNILMLPCKL